MSKKTKTMCGNVVAMNRAKLEGLFEYRGIYKRKADEYAAAVAQIDKDIAETTTSGKQVRINKQLITADDAGRVLIEQL